MNLFSNSLWIIFIAISFYVVSPGKPGEPPESKKPRNCYFAVQQTSSLENGPRLKSATTKSTCSDKHIDLLSLSQNTDGHYFGAPHEAALILARFQALYLNEDSDLSKWKGETICTKHLNELSRQFYAQDYMHAKRRGTDFLCGFPEKGHAAKAVKGLELTYSQAKYLLENRHFHLLPGTPMCRKHHDEMIGMAETSAHASTLDLEETGGREEMDVDEDPEGVCMGDGDDAADRDYRYHTTPNPLKRAFWDFAKAAGVSRVRCEKPWEDITNRARNYRGNAGASLVEAMIRLMEPTENGQSNLKRMVIASLQGDAPYLDQELVAIEIMSQVAEHYGKAENAHDRIWTLAPFTKLFGPTIMSQFIPGLSKRMWDAAEKLAIDQQSPICLTQLPYGTSTIKDSHGKKIEVTNAVRQAGIYAIIDMYIAYMKEVKLEHLLLKRTTMYNILHYLPIKKAHSLTCLDQYAADASNGFIAIGRMWDDLVKESQLPKSDGDHMKRAFDETKLYLKGNYRLHLKLESLYSDHCLLWGLSDPKNPAFASPHNSHVHKQRCPECLAIDILFKDTKELLKQLSEKSGLSFDLQKKLDGYVHDFNIQSQKIMDLKYHYARAAYVNMAIQRLIAGTKKNQGDCIDNGLLAKVGGQAVPRAPVGVLWEGGAKVISTHANISGKAVTHAAAHILGETEQSATAVVAILTHYLKELKIMGIEEVMIVSDNAPNYHNSALMSSMGSMLELTGVDVLSYTFFEKQMGKSPADQKIGLFKRDMLSYRDAQHDVVTAEQMFEALNAPKQLRAASFYLATVKETKVSTSKIPNIKQYGHFEFHGKHSARYWRFPGIGEGEMIHNLVPTEAHLVVSKKGGKLATPQLNVQDRKRIEESHTKPAGSYDEPTFWHLPHERAAQFDFEPNDQDDPIVHPNNPLLYNSAASPKSSLFYCRQCGSSFIRYSNLLKHINSQAHKIRPEKVKLLDRVLGLFMRSIESVLTHIPHTPISEVAKAFLQKKSDEELPQGFAISGVKRRVRNPETTKAFIKKLYFEYAGRGDKLRAADAERLMRADKFILPQDWMERCSIKNYINTLKSKTPTLRVYRAALEPEKEEDDDECELHDEVIPEADEDIFVTEEDWHAHLTPAILKKIFIESTKPVTPKTQVPAGATEFD